jgi:two-component system chemotaxis response regulator CheB
MPSLELIVIGASAGGLDGLITIVKRLPAASPPVLVVMHTSSSGTTHLPKILGRVSSLPVAAAKQGAKLGRGRVLVAPPDFHLLVTKKGVSLGRGPRENGFRPAIDPLFRSAAYQYGPRVMGIILSGALDDGAYGMQVIQKHGGVTVVQDPDEATIPSMPLSVLSSVAVDHVMRAAAIADLVATYAERGVKGGAVMKRPEDPEPQDPARTTEVEDMEQIFGPPSGLTCPDCGGALWEIAESSRQRYRCHVGHQFSPEALESAHRDAVEGALWTAVRILEEHAALRERLAERSNAAGLAAVSAGFRQSGQDSHRQAEAIRRLLFSRTVAPPGEAGPEGQRTVRAPRSRSAKNRSRKTGRRAA